MIPEQAVVAAKLFEGLHKKIAGGLVVPYVCPAGYWTIGWGHLCKKDTAPKTYDQAEADLIRDLQNTYKAVIRLCPRLLWEDDARLAAIIDFTFNLGAGRLKASTLRGRINEGNWEEAEKELRRWVYGGGKVLPGLVRRREYEVNLLQQGAVNGLSSTDYCSKD